MKKNSEDNKSISISDVFALQDSLKKDTDLDKPDSELTTEQLVNKTIYKVLDSAIEKSVGKQDKEKIDEAREQMDLIVKFQNNLSKLTQLGKEIEKNFIYQIAYIISRFHKKENHFRLVVDGLTNDALHKEGISNAERVEVAKKVLEIVKVYREKVVKELIGKQEILGALLPAFEKILNEMDFDLLDEEAKEKINSEQIKSQLEEWLTLSKELFKYRKKATEAIKDSLEMEEIIPKHIIEKDGDITQNLSSVAGIEMKTKADRVVKLAKEGDEAENRIEEKRSKLSEQLYGKSEDYMDIKKEETKTVIPNPLEEKGWYRLLKVIYIVALGLAILFVIMGSIEEGFGFFFWGAVITWVIFALIKKAFFYIVLGKSK